jgi:hypothetical protein
VTNDLLGRRCAWLILASIVTFTIPAAPAAAHEDHVVGSLLVSIGWANEPALTGVPNAVEVVVTTSEGGPITELGSSALTVEVTFGTETSVFGLAPHGASGGFTALIVPTQPGTYTFHVSGVVLEQPIDITTVCSEQTFDCVTDISSAQFPSVDLSDGQLTERLDRELARAERAEDTAATARTLAVAALAVAGFGVFAGVVLGIRRGHSRRP